MGSPEEPAPARSSDHRCRVFLPFAKVGDACLACFACFACPLACCCIARGTLVHL